MDKTIDSKKLVMTFHWLSVTQNIFCFKTWNITVIDEFRDIFSMFFVKDGSIAPRTIGEPCHNMNEH